jgi:hypothetical protein
VSFIEHERQLDPSDSALGHRAATAGIETWFPPLNLMIQHAAVKAQGRLKVYFERAVVRPNCSYPFTQWAAMLDRRYIARTSCRSVRQLSAQRSERQARCGRKARPSHA